MTSFSKWSVADYTIVVGKIRLILKLAVHARIERQSAILLRPVRGTVLRTAVV